MSGTIHYRACHLCEAICGLEITTRGADSMAIYAGNPSVHNYGMMPHPQYALGYLRTRNRYSAT